jgi:hypothetical protein
LFDVSKGYDRRTALEPQNRIVYDLLAH